MRNTLSHYYLLLIGLITISFSCNKSNDPIQALKEAEKVSIQSENGLYLSEDRKKEYQLFADRSKAFGWEEFYLEFDKDDKVILRSSRYEPIGISENGLLSGNTAENLNPIKFLITYEDSSFYLKPERGIIKISSDKEVEYSEASGGKSSQLKVRIIPPKVFPGFTSKQWLPFELGIGFLFFSLLLFTYKRNKNLSLVLLILGSFSIRVFVALLTDHFFVWDEQFHALVAKNMIEHPFKPTLYEHPVLPYNYKNWITNHIWLHKQPLFLWQMAMSIKLFGTNVFAVRFPSILMSTIVTWFIYRMGKITINKTVGYISAFLFVFSYFNLELQSGLIHTDHNDSAFLFYMTASIWAYLEYENNEGKSKRLFLILIGLFSGAAVLVKWLTGILVYSGWGLSILLIKERRIKLRNYLDLLFSSFITLIVFLPWQVYIINRFPKESSHEYEFNTRHFFEVIENHGGNFWHHVNLMEDIYQFDKFILLLSFAILIFFIKNKVHKIAFLTFFISIYLFYSIAATKMIAFTFCISPLLYLGMGCVFYLLIWKQSERVFSSNYKVLAFVIIAGTIGYLSFQSLNLEMIKKKHSTWVKESFSIYTKRLKTTPFIRELPTKIPDINEYVIFNCHEYERDNILMMFYTDVRASYTFIPNQEQIQLIKDKGLKIAVLDNGKLPAYINNDREIKKILGYWN